MFRVLHSFELAITCVCNVLPFINESSFIYFYLCDLTFRTILNNLENLLLEALTATLLFSAPIHEL